MRFSKWLVAWSLAGIAASDSSKSHNDDAPQVYSTSGTVIGHRSPHRPNTFEFLGIKYGQAPVGKLRFAAPERYVAPPSVVYNASKWVGSTCDQFQ